MKKIAFIFSIAIVLAGSWLLYAGGPGVWLGGAPNSPVQGNATDGYSLDGSLSIPTVETPDLRSGVSLFQITANTVLTTAETDGRVYYISDATARTIQFPNLTASTWQGKAVYFTDGRPDSGITLFCTGVSIQYGSGPQSGTGTTLFVNALSGNSNYTIGFIGALRAGIPVWKQIFGDLTWFTKP